MPELYAAASPTHLQSTVRLVNHLPHAEAAVSGEPIGSPAYRAVRAAQVPGYEPLAAAFAAHAHGYARVFGALLSPDGEHPDADDRAALDRALAHHEGGMSAVALALILADPHPTDRHEFAEAGLRALYFAALGQPYPDPERVVLPVVRTPDR